MVEGIEGKAESGEVGVGSLQNRCTLSVGVALIRSRLIRTIKRAGLTPWCKPWQNLRSSRETELADRFPIQVVTAWIGNSITAAKRHYLQVTDSHFDDISGDDGSGARWSKWCKQGAEPGSKDAVKTVVWQQPIALYCATKPHKGFEPLFPGGKPDVLGH